MVRIPACGYGHQWEGRQGWQTQWRWFHLGNLRRRGCRARKMGSEATECRSYRLLLLCRYARGARRQNQEPVSEGSNAWAGVARNRGQIQLVCGYGQRHGIFKAVAHVQDPEAAVLCRVVHTDSSRHVDRVED